MYVGAEDHLSQSPTQDHAPVILNRLQMLLAYYTGTFAFSFSVMLTFVVSLRARELGASLPQIGLLIGASSLLAAGTSIMAGAMTQKIGAHRVFYIGTALSAVLTVILGFTTEYWAIVGLQTIMGPIRTGSWVASQTYITGVGSPKDRITINGRFGFATNVGTWIHPIIIGVVSDLIGFQGAIFFIAGVAGIYTIAGLSLPAVYIPKPTATGGGGGSSLGFGAALSQLKVRGIQIAVSFTFVRVWYQTAWTTFFPVYLVDNGMTASLAATVVASTSVMAMITALLVGRIEHWASREILTAATLGIGVLGVAISPLLDFMPLVYFPAMLYGIGVGVSLPMLLALFSDAAPAGGRGVALGLRTSSNQVAAFIAPTSSGAIIGSVGVGMGLLASSGVGWAILGIGLVLYQGQKRGRARAQAEPTPVDS